jgi:hypothetical protein
MIHKFFDAVHSMTVFSEPYTEFRKLLHDRYIELLLANDNVASATATCLANYPKHSPVQRNDTRWIQM